MSFDELSSLSISEIAQDDCLLFMWVVSPFLPECIKVGESWGFVYKTVAFIWDKHYVLPGHYTMARCEMCLVFKKGKIPKPRGKRNICQLLSVRRGNHSQKPHQARQNITEMFPHHEKIELFARERFAGWDAWGNEV